MGGVDSPQVLSEIHSTVVLSRPGKPPLSSPENKKKTPKPIKSLTVFIILQYSISGHIHPGAPFRPLLRPVLLVAFGLSIGRILLRIVVVGGNRLGFPVLPPVHPHHVKISRRQPYHDPAHNHRPHQDEHYRLTAILPQHHLPPSSNR